MTDIQNIEVSPMEHPLAGQVIALTSGGTGGHMFPAVALARALVRRGAHVLFFTDARASRYTEGVEGVETIILPAGGIAGTRRLRRGRGGRRRAQRSVPLCP